MRAQSITDLISQILKGDFANRNFTFDKDLAPSTGWTMGKCDILDTALESDNVFFIMHGFLV